MGMGGLAQQRSQQQAAMLQQQEQFYALHEYYRRKGMTLISVYTDRARGIERITVQRKTTIPKVAR